MKTTLGKVDSRALSPGQDVCLGQDTRGRSEAFSEDCGVGVAVEQRPAPWYFLMLSAQGSQL